MEFRGIDSTDREYMDTGNATGGGGERRGRKCGVFTSSSVPKRHRKEEEKKRRHRDSTEKYNKDGKIDTILSVGSCALYAGRSYGFCCLGF